MAKTKGFLLSEKSMFSVYHKGLDFYYFKGLPIVRYYAPISRQKQKKTRTVSPKKYILNTYFKAYNLSYNALSPLTKALLKAEARFYNMSSKDLYFYYFIRYLVENKNCNLLFSDIYFYNYNNTLIIDFLTSDLNNFFLTFFNKIPEPLRKYRKFRGTYELCKVPIALFEAPAYLIPFSLSSPTYTVPAALVAGYYRFTGSRQMWYSKSPGEVYPLLLSLIESDLARHYGYYPPPAAWSTITNAHYTDKRLYANIQHKHSIYFYKFDAISEYHKIKKIYFDFSNIQFNFYYDQNYFRPPHDFIRFTFASYDLFIPRTLQYLTFPRVPSGFSVPARIYAVFYTPFTFAKPHHYYSILPRGKSISITYEIKNVPVLKAIKGRYFLFRLYVDPSVYDYYNAILVNTATKNTYARLTPFFKPRKLMPLLKSMPPPDPVQYAFEHDFYEDIPISTTIPSPQYNVDEYSENDLYKNAPDLPKTTNFSPFTHFYNNVYRNYLQVPNWTDQDFLRYFVEF